MAAWFFWQARTSGIRHIKLGLTEHSTNGGDETAAEFSVDTSMAKMCVKEWWPSRNCTLPTFVGAGTLSRLCTSHVEAFALSPLQPPDAGIEEIICARIIVPQCHNPCASLTVNASYFSSYCRVFAVLLPARNLFGSMKTRKNLLTSDCRSVNRAGKESSTQTDLSIGYLLSTANTERWKYGDCRAHSRGILYMLLKTRNAM
ncbi:hypothetical protein DFH09DRAFT_1083894 [Mycena vulgaris]|nr:hypothetical protein DFH09DRAFT_1083894 [Mycena vulgaris]